MVVICVPSFLFINNITLCGCLWKAQPLSVYLFGRLFFVSGINAWLMLTVLEILFQSFSTIWVIYTLLNPPSLQSYLNSLSATSRQILRRFTCPSNTQFLAREGSVNSYSKDTKQRIDVMTNITNCVSLSNGI